MTEDKKKQLALKEDLNVTRVLDPDLADKTLTLTEEDIDYELGAALFDPVDESADSQTEKTQDDDIDFELDDNILEAADDIKDSKSSSPAVDDVDFDLNEFAEDIAQGGSVTDEGGLTGDEVDFDLDDVAVEIAPDQAPTAQEMLDDGVEFELEDTVIEAPVPELQTAPTTDAPGGDVDAGIDELIAQATVPKDGSSELKEFDLDAILAEDDDLDDIDIGLPTDGAAREEEIDDAIDFELEEVVETSSPPPQPEDSPPEPAPTAEVVETGPDAETDIGVPEDWSEPTPAEIEDRVEPSATQSPEPDMDRLEAVVERAVRETVSKVLEKMLPGLIDEVVARELEKLRDELEDD